MTRSAVRIPSLKTWPQQTIFDATYRPAAPPAHVVRDIKARRWRWGLKWESDVMDWQGAVSIVAALAVVVNVIYTVYTRHIAVEARNQARDAERQADAAETAAAAATSQAKEAQRQAAAAERQAEAAERSIAIMEKHLQVDDDRCLQEQIEIARKDMSAAVAIFDLVVRAIGNPHCLDRPIDRGHAMNVCQSVEKVTQRFRLYPGLENACLSEWGHKLGLVWSSEIFQGEWEPGLSAKYPDFINIARECAKKAGTQ